ncbi:MAG: hypothetical protein E7487_10075 [Ruminococcaceae bacterium]|nr:hypothetical protein [Oscillospiraceae bacterium]
MKRMVLLSLALFLLFSFAGCSTAQSSDETDPWGISLSATNVTSTGMSLKCTQSGGDYTGTLETGADYYLEKKDGNEWTAAETISDLIFTAIGYTIPLDQTTTWEINWEFAYGELPAGDYRICKDIMDFRGAGDYTERTYYAEFSIKD